MVLVSASVRAVAPLGWWVIAGSAAFAAMGGYSGLRFWAGRRIVSWTPAKAMDQLRVLGVTLLPNTVMFAAFCFIGIVSRIGGHVHSNSGQMALAVVTILLGFVALVAFAISASLFFFTKPQRFVPPRYRQL